jgi:hypothetical protein
MERDPSKPRSLALQLSWPDAERLVAGRERIYFDRIWNDFTGDPGKPDEAPRNFFTATYAVPRDCVSRQELLGDALCGEPLDVSSACHHLLVCDK